MKRRNAEPGKLRRPMKRTKIAEGMYGGSIVYMKFVFVWFSIALADYMMEFRFEFLWPFWVMMCTVYDLLRYQGIGITVFFICITLTTDIICFLFIPVQYIMVIASTLVWLQFVWNAITDKFTCLPTLAVCCIVVYIEGVLRANERSNIIAGFDIYRPLAAHCVGLPVISLGFGVKTYVDEKLRLRKHRKVKEENDFYYQLLREALPETELEQEGEEPDGTSVPNGVDNATEPRYGHMNGVRQRRVSKEQNGYCADEHTQLQIKLERLERHLAEQTRNKTQHTQTCSHSGSQSSLNDDDTANHKCSAKSIKCDKKEVISSKEDKRKNRNKDKEREKESSDSNKGTQTKEEIFKELECINHNCSYKERDREMREREKEIEIEREKEKEREKERERERERNMRELRETAEELKKIKLELAAALCNEAEAKRALTNAAAAERQRKAEHHHLKQQHAALQHKVSGWRAAASEKAALERALADERRARARADIMLQRARNNSRTESCDREVCKNRVRQHETETQTLKQEVQRTTDMVKQLQKDLLQARAKPEPRADSPSSPLGRMVAALRERAVQLDHALSDETRVKLDLLSALGEARRQLAVQQVAIEKHDKEKKEMKAQILAVTPPPTNSSPFIPKSRVQDGSPLDPNATVYTPRQLCSDA